MDWKDPVKKKEYDRKYYQANREKRLAQKKIYYKNNKEQINAREKKYRKENSEKIREQRKKYRDNNWVEISAREQKWRKENPEKFHKCHLIGNWKSRGLIVDDPDEYESIYYLVMSTENCEGCGCILTGHKPRTSTSRCMDHDHFTGKFRAVLCISCNSSQPEQPKQIKNNINIDEII